MDSLPYKVYTGSYNAKNYVVLRDDDFYCVRQLGGQKLDIALIVSVGSGSFPLPVEDSERVDAQEVLHFGKHWFRAAIEFIPRYKRLIKLLTNAVRNCSGMMSYCCTPNITEVVFDS